MFVFPATVPSSAAARRASASPLLDALFAQAAPTGGAVRAPAMDVSEDAAGYTLAFEVPGVARESLKLTIHGRRVALSTESPAGPRADAPQADQADKGETRVLYRERSAPRYARTVVLPAEVDAASATARFENGVLSVTVARQQAAGARQVTIG